MEAKAFSSTHRTKVFADGIAISDPISREVKWEAKLYE